MPRKSSGGRSAPRPRAASHTPVHNPPKPVSSAPPPAPVQGPNGNATGGLGAAVSDGLAWGTGTAVAHRAVDAVMGPRVIQHENVPAAAPASAPAQNTTSHAGSEACSSQSKALQECLNNYGSDISKCQFYMDMFQECRRSSGAALSA